MQKGLNPHQYIICQKRQIGALNEHIRAVHKGLKPHQCLICQKSFGSQTDAVRKGLKLHQCLICKKSFGLPGYLNRHIRIFIINV